MIKIQEVHIWHGSLNLSAEKLEHLAQTLADDEHQRANRFRFSQHKENFIAARGLLRMLLGSYVNLEPNQIQFKYSDRGKPFLANLDINEQIYFNLSHSQGYAVYAFCCHENIGIDVEYMRGLEDFQQLAKSFFSPQEYTFINSLPIHEQSAAFFHLWTCKEAYLKATGEGLAGLTQVEVILQDDQPPQLLNLSANDQSIPWFLHQFTPHPGYVAALAVPGDNWQLKFQQLSY